MIGRKNWTAYRSACLGALALLAVGCAASQQEPTAQPAEQLTCPRVEDPLQTVNFEVTAPAPYSDAERACWANWPQAQTLAQGPNGQWVDVRDAGTVRRLGLHGVTNVGLADLADKAFLKGQSLILIGSGVDLRALTQRCVALRQSGQFRDVHVLLGGVRAWRLAGQAITSNGDALAPEQASAQELWLGAADGVWQIAALGLTPQQRQNLPVPEKQVLDLGPNIPQAVAELQNRIAEPLPAHQRWLVVTADAAQLEQAQTLWSQQASTTDAGQTPIWLAGGWPAYISWLQQQQTLAAHAGRTLPRICGM
jgi:rhodanese-related sulfurtransferase